jgi:hypothetical protein
LGGKVFNNCLTAYFTLVSFSCSLTGAKAIFALQIPRHTGLRDLTSITSTTIADDMLAFIKKQKLHIGSKRIILKGGVRY